MKVTRAFLLGLLATAWTNAGLAQEAGPTVLAKGLFSYQAPPGWTLMTSPLSKFPVSVGMANPGQRPNIFVAVRPFPGGMAAYTAVILTYLRAKAGTTIVSRQPFFTAAKLDGNRIVTIQAMPKINVQLIYYLFDGGGGNKLMIAACCALSDATHETPLFDASVRTFSLE